MHSLPFSCLHFSLFTFLHCSLLTGWRAGLPRKQPRGFSRRGERAQPEPVADDASGSARSMGWERLPRMSKWWWGGGSHFEDRRARCPVVGSPAPLPPPRWSRSLGGCPSAAGRCARAGSLFPSVQGERARAIFSQRLPSLPQESSWAQPGQEHNYFRQSDQNGTAPPIPTPREPKLLPPLPQRPEKNRGCREEELVMFQVGMFSVAQEMRPPLTQRTRWPEQHLRGKAGGTTLRTRPPGSLSPAPLGLVFRALILAPQHKRAGGQRRKSL